MSLLRREDKLQKAHKKIRELEDRLNEQAAELALIGRAGMEVRKEDVKQLADFRKTNKDLIEFIEKVANSKSKYAKEARNLLGL